MKQYRNDFLLVVGLLICTLIFTAFLMGGKGKMADKAVVSCSGTVIAEIPMSEEGIYVLQLGNETTLTRTESEPKGDTIDYNCFRMQDGAVKMLSADCKGQDCVRQTPVDEQGESIICLPHKVVIQIVSDKESDEDAVTW